MVLQHPCYNADSQFGLSDLEGAQRIVANAIVAGTISELTGGKFANGVMSAAFRVAFNDSLRSMNDWDSWIDPNLENKDDGGRPDFITDSLEGNDLLRAMAVVVGSAEAMLGGAMCATVAGCAIGSSLIAYGLKNVYEGAHQSPGVMRQGHQNLFGETAGNWTYLAADLGFAGYSLLKPIYTPAPPRTSNVIRVNGNPQAVRAPPRQMPAYSAMSGLEIGRDGIVIFNSIYEQGNK